MIVESERDKTDEYGDTHVYICFLIATFEVNLKI